MLKKIFSPNRFCPKCGKPISGKATLCTGCNAFDFSFKDIFIVLCNSCNSYLENNKWSSYDDVNTPIKKIAERSIKAKVKILELTDDESSLITAYKAGVKKDISIGVSYHSEEFSVPAKLEITLCDKCSKKGTTYFEGILQLRNINEEIISYVENELTKQRRKGIFLNKKQVLKKDSDVDLYITDQGYTRVLAGKLRRQFGGVMKKNEELFSQDKQRSKNLYRLAILLEFPKYSKGDAIKLDGNIYIIQSLSDKIHVTNMLTGKKTSMPYSGEYDILKPSTLLLIKKYPEYEVLDPQTYYQARLMNPSKYLEINQKLLVIIDGSEAWMV
jgi:NMD protein affecting ribosome stability and mRNA decay